VEFQIEAKHRLDLHYGAGQIVPWFTGFENRHIGLDDARSGGPWSRGEKMLRGKLRCRAKKADQNGPMCPPANELLPFATANRCASAVKLLIAALSTDFHRPYPQEHDPNRFAEQLRVESIIA
jgi:hypothetical protein